MKDIGKRGSECVLMDNKANKQKTPFSSNTKKLVHEKRLKKYNKSEARTEKSAGGAKLLCKSVGLDHKQIITTMCTNKHFAAEKKTLTAAWLMKLCV